MSEQQKRRFWSTEEKQKIVSQCAVPGVSVSQVARRYDVNANLVFKWRRELPSSAPEAINAIDFLPVSVGHSAALITQEPESSPAAAPDGKISISVTGGTRLEINGRFDGDAVARLIKGLNS
jgi:transposase